MRRMAAVCATALLPLGALWAAGTRPAVGAPSGALQRMLPEDPVASGAPAAPAHTAGELAERLRDHPRHGTDLEIRRVENPAATRVVVVIPQFHRSPLLPLLWSSLGAAVAGIQENIDLIVSTLVQQHRMRCVGTEGSWSDHIGRSQELEDLARQAEELAALRDEVGQRMGPLEPEVHQAAQDAVRLLQPYLQRQLFTLDGVGLALARRSKAGVLRFGLEEASLNQRALKLLATMRPLEEDLARLEPEGQPDLEDAMGTMWLDEYPTFERTVGAPLMNALATVDAARRRSLSQHVELEADVLGRFGRLANHITQTLLRPDDVASYHQYYLDVRKPAATPQAAPKPLLPPQLRKVDALRSRLARLQAEYEQVSGIGRERAAVKRVLRRMDSGHLSQCVLVMGANHEEGLVKELLQRTGGRMGVVVVQPWAGDEQKASMDGGTGDGG